MKMSQVAPQLRPHIRMTPPLPIGSAFGRWLVRRSIAALDRDRRYEAILLEKRRTTEGVALRVYTPTGARTGAALLWIHGGGLVIGSAAQDDPFCAETARALGIVVVSLDYRLASEHPFPAPVDDCHAAWTWLQGSAAQLQIDPLRVAVGGQSAGGGLAAGLVQRIHDAGGAQPAAQWLFCPMLDDRTAARTHLDAIRHRIWDNRRNRIGWRAYLGAEPGVETLPEYAAPARRNDLHGLPPTWMGVGDIDIFFEEDRTYAARLNAAGVACSLEVVPGAPHGFEVIAARTKLAQSYLARGREWLREILVGTPRSS